MKTCQQRLAEEQAGYAPSPPQVLADKPRGPRRTRAKTPSATIAAVPAAQSAALEEPQALVQVWVDSARAADDPSHQLTIPSALIPELLRFINNVRDQAKEAPAATSSSSSTKVTLSSESPQLAPGPLSSRSEPQLPKPSPPMVSQIAPAPLLSPLQESSQPMAPQSAPAGAVSPFHKTLSPMATHDSPTSHIEAPSHKTSHPAQPPRISQPINTASQITGPALAVQQVAPSHSDVGDKQTLGQVMLDQGIREVVNSHQTGPGCKTLSSPKRPMARRSSRRERRPSSRKPPAPRPIKRKLSPVPSDPETLRAVGLPSMFRKYRHLPAYTADGSVLYGPVTPSHDHMKFHQADEAATNKDSDVDEVSTPQTPQARSSVPGRLIRPARSVKRQFGFSPLETISERSESTPPTKPVKNPPPIRFPSRTLDRMNKNKRMRWSSPVTIAEVEFYGNTGEDKEEEADIAGHQPGKVRRTSQSPNFSSQRGGSPDESRSHSDYQSTKKTPLPITNMAGTFKVPSPVDSDWSDSQSEDEESSQAATVPSSAVADPGPTFRPQFIANGYKEWLQTAPPAVRAALGQMDVDLNMAGAAFQRGIENFTTSWTATGHMSHLGHANQTQSKSTPDSTCKCCCILITQTQPLAPSHHHHHQRTSLALRKLPQGGFSSGM